MAYATDRQQSLHLYTTQLECHRTSRANDYAGMSLSGNVDSGTQAVLGGACAAGPVVNVPPVAALGCEQATMIAAPPPGGNFAIETYTVHCNN